MLPITGLTKAAESPKARSSRSAGTFTVAEETPCGAAVAADEPASVSLGGLLSLQEQDAPEPATDRRARRHGRAMLDALRRLQTGLLSAAGDAGALEHLAALLDDAPEAEDPALRATLAQVALRVRVELVRYGFA